ncbi:MAG: tRNA-dihydrouridine synthase [Candidatus Zixiibacteriota bacterium]|nr:MAG: tRNA-dihydrouridine synthase [candidate division Zixibacteria bacterium]
MVVFRGFWNDIKRPIMALAPMLDVTDAAMRQMVIRHGKPDVMFTEFVSTDGLCSPGQHKLVGDLSYEDNEHPIVAQVYGKNPDKFYLSAPLIQKLGFDGIDINMGCPVKNVTKTGSGAALIKTPHLAKEIITATREGAPDLPVSVKTRIGYNSIVIDEWVSHLLETEPAAITLHLRTCKEMSDAPAHWDKVGVAVDLAADTDTLIIGNGDVTSLEQAHQLATDTGVDGVMIGRGIYGNPWFFDPARPYEEITVEEKLDAIVEHAEQFVESFGAAKNFVAIRKHLRAYASGFRGSKELRIRLVEETNSVDDVRRIVEDFRVKTRTDPPCFD